jgi:hypothetical protein
MTIGTAIAGAINHNLALTRELIEAAETWPWSDAVFLQTASMDLSMSLPP